MSGALVAVLRVVGLLWAIGGVFIMLNARRGDDPDAVRWVFVGGALSFVAGLLLLVGSPWALVTIALLLLQQGAFHLRQIRALPRGTPRPRPTQLLAAALIGVLALLAHAPGLGL